MSETLLQTNNLSKSFFGVAAIEDVSIKVHDGELMGLIGPNGSGKTTFFNCVSGLLRPERGEVLFRGQPITDWPPHRIALGGISRTFQESRIFSRLTVMENMLVSLQEYRDRSLLARVLATSRVKSFERAGYDRALDLLEMVSLVHLKDRPAGNLSYGQSKLLGFASALIAEPELLLLDEPAAGINLTLLNDIKSYIQWVNADGLTILLVEHNMDVVMDLCRRVIVLDHGRKIAEGTPEEIQNNELVLEAYFGK